MSAHESTPASRLLEEHGEERGLLRSLGGCQSSELFQMGKLRPSLATSQWQSQHSAPSLLVASLLQLG